MPLPLGINQCLSAAHRAYSTVMSSKGLDIFAGGSRAHGLGGHSDIHHATVNSGLLLTRPLSLPLPPLLLPPSSHTWPFLFRAVSPRSSFSSRYTSSSSNRIELFRHILEGMRKGERERKWKEKILGWKGSWTDVAMDFERFDERRVEQSEGVERNRCSLIGGVSAGMVQLPVDRRRP